MPEEENAGVEAPELQAATPAAETEQTEERQETAQEKKQRNSVEYNWAEARRKMQELERQNRELAEQVDKMQKPQAPVNEYEEIDKLADDDLMTKAAAKKLAARMAKEVAEQVIKQREASTVDERLSNKFSDYADVVSKENIELLKQTEPELALSLWKLADDPYAQGVAAYKMIKKLGVAQPPSKSLEKKKAEENSQKPVSVNAATKQSAIGNAHLFENGLTKELKSQLWKEMQQAMKGA